MGSAPDFGFRRRTLKNITTEYTEKKKVTEYTEEKQQNKFDLFKNPTHSPKSNNE